jgi:hypothetical protein
MVYGVDVTVHHILDRPSGDLHTYYTYTLTFDSTIIGESQKFCPLNIGSPFPEQGLICSLFFEKAVFVDIDRRQFAK